MKIIAGRKLKQHNTEREIIVLSSSSEDENEDEDPFPTEIKRNNKKVDLTRSVTVFKIRKVNIAFPPYSGYVPLARNIIGKLCTQFRSVRHPREIFYGEDGKLELTKHNRANLQIMYDVEHDVQQEIQDLFTYPGNPINDRYFDCLMRYLK